MVGEFQCRMRVAKTSEGAAGFFFPSPYVCAKSGWRAPPLFAQTYGEGKKNTAAPSGRPSLLHASYTEIRPPCTSSCSCPCPLYLDDIDILYHAGCGLNEVTLLMCSGYEIELFTVPAYGPSLLLLDVVQCFS